MPGAVVHIRPEQNESGGVKLKEAEMATDSRGEFSFRVPAVPVKWTVHVKANGYESQTRTVSIEGEQRFDLSFQLEPEHKTADQKGKGEAR